MESPSLISSSADMCCDRKTGASGVNLNVVKCKSLGLGASTGFEVACSLFRFGVVGRDRREEEESSDN